MNYRHAFHAGNHCDVLKHAALALILERLRDKEKPFIILDTHAGRGLYDLESQEARRSGEHQGGILKIINDPSPPASLHPYLDAVRRQNPFGGLRWYPGSPMIARDALRPQDSAKFCELHPDERVALDRAIGGDPRIRIFDLDGYQSVRAFLPPKERRGLVLIDPPFEKPGEYERVADAIADGVARWAGGVYMIWRPIKDETGYAAFLDAVAPLRLEKSLVVSLAVAGPAANTLTGSGLFIINPTFGLSDALAAALPYLAARLAAAPGGGWSLVETEKGAVIRNEAGAA